MGVRAVVTDRFQNKRHGASTHQNESEGRYRLVRQLIYLYLAILVDCRSWIRSGKVPAVRVTGYCLMNHYSLCRTPVPAPSDRVSSPLEYETGLTEPRRIIDKVDDMEVAAPVLLTICTRYNGF